VVLVRAGDPRLAPPAEGDRAASGRGVAG